MHRRRPARAGPWHAPAATHDRVRGRGQAAPARRGARDWPARARGEWSWRRSRPRRAPQLVLDAFEHADCATVVVTPADVGEADVAQHLLRGDVLRMRDADD